jgi:hypothetical protein
LGPGLKLKENLCTLTPIFCHAKNSNKIVYLNPEIFGAKLKAEENLFTSTPKRFWPSLKLKCNLCTSTQIFLPRKKFK